MQSKAATVEQYLAELPPDRKSAVQAIRSVILKNLDKKYEEGMQYGMIGYYVPHSVFPDGYHCDPRQPLPFAGLASQKNHMSVYLMSLYEEGAEGKWFRTAWESSGRKLDMGKCCIRFKKLEDVALDVLGEAIRRMPVDRHIEIYRAARSGAMKKSPASSRVATKKKPAARSAKSAKAAVKPRRGTSAAPRKSGKTVTRRSRKK
jgi:hypothetical protein